MSEHAIRLTDDEVREVLDGTRAEVRVAFTDQPSLHPSIKASSAMWGWESRRHGRTTGSVLLPDELFRASSIVLDACPFGRPGDTIWVQETWQAWVRTNVECDEWEVAENYRVKERTHDQLEFRATSDSTGPWRSRTTMPRWASRIDLTLTEIKAERVLNVWVWVLVFKREGCES